MTNYQRCVIWNLDGHFWAARFGVASDAKGHDVKNHPKTAFGRHGGWRVDFEDTQCH